MSIQSGSRVSYISTSMSITYSTVVIYSPNFGQKTEIDFQMYANELYPIVKPQ